MKKEICYKVMKNGKYIEETTDTGVYRLITPKQDADNTFDHYAWRGYNLPDVISYLKELSINPRNIAIHEIEPMTTTLVFVDGVFINIKEVGYCDHEDCNEPHMLHNMHYFQIDNCEQPQLYCTKHYDELTGYTNSYHANQDSDTTEEVGK